MGQWEDPIPDAEAAAAGGARPGEADTVEIFRVEGPYGRHLDNEVLDPVRPQVPDEWDDDDWVLDDAVVPRMAGYVIPGTAISDRQPDRADEDDEDDPQHRRAMLVWRSAVVASLALALVLIVVSVVTTIGNNSHPTASSPDLAGSLPTAAASTAGPADGAMTEQPADGMAPMTTPAVADSAAAPQGSQPIAAAAPTAPGGGAGAGVTPRPTSGANPGPAAQPTNSVARCGPVTALLFLFWTLLGVGPC